MRRSPARNADRGAVVGATSRWRGASLHSDAFRQISNYAGASPVRADRVGQQLEHFGLNVPILQDTALMQQTALRKRSKSYTSNFAGSKLNPA